jgi:hypothetical protein
VRARFRRQLALRKSYLRTSHEASRQSTILAAVQAGTWLRAGPTTSQGLCRWAHDRCGLSQHQHVKQAPGSVTIRAAAPRQEVVLPCAATSIDAGGHTSAEVP